MFEAAGVARMERCIVTWCMPNRQGMAKLDCYLDPNEHKYFITCESVELAIKEEQARARKGELPGGSVGIPNEAEREGANRNEHDELDAEDLKVLRQEFMDLKIANRAKDYLI